MMFVDRVKIRVVAGKGGDGIVAFRREKYVPRGGPSGGNGGKGGDIIFEVDENLQTLLDFYYIHLIKAEKGKRGGNSEKTGASGGDRIVKVPPGTVLMNEETGEIIADLAAGSLVVARGGRGGRGNASFASSSNQAPRMFTEGKSGEEFSLILELKLIADIGLTGAPNAGKSTMLSKISRARPKIADYPFTTIEPNLGIVELDNERRFVACDIPGLIEGASGGKGLGLDFLRHIERTRLLLLLVDLTDEPKSQLEMLEKELSSYADGILDEKPRIVVGTKLDAAEKSENWKKQLGKDARFVSSITGEGLKELLEEVWAKLQKERDFIENGPGREE